MRTILIAVEILIFMAVSYSQGINKIPFASSGNKIEIAVENGSTVVVSGVKVEVQNIPSWLRFTPTSHAISMMKARSEQQVSFTFSVDKAAPVNREQTLKYIISTPNGERWTREIKVSVSAPERYELFQNYPNPFNPTTIIGYQLPVDCLVRLKVYNVIGQEVTILKDGEETAGYHEVVWDASSAASGVYYNRLTVTEQSGKQLYQEIRKLVLMK